MGKSDASSNGYLGEVRPATSLPLHAPATPRGYGSTARQILCAQQPAGTWPVGSAVCVPPTGRRTVSNGSAVVSVAGNETFLDRPPAAPLPQRVALKAAHYREICGALHHGRSPFHICASLHSPWLARSGTHTTWVHPCWAHKAKGPKPEDFSPFCDEVGLVGRAGIEPATN